MALSSSLDFILPLSHTEPPLSTTQADFQQVINLTTAIQHAATEAKTALSDPTLEATFIHLSNIIGYFKDLREFLCKHGEPSSANLNEVAAPFIEEMLSLYPSEGGDDMSVSHHEASSPSPRAPAFLPPATDSHTSDQLAAIKNLLLDMNQCLIRVKSRPVQKSTPAPAPTPSSNNPASSPVNPSSQNNGRNRSFAQAAAAPPSAPAPPPVSSPSGTAPNPVRPAKPNPSPLQKSTAYTVSFCSHLPPVECHLPSHVIVTALNNFFRDKPTAANLCCVRAVWSQFGNCTLFLSGRARERLVDPQERILRDGDDDERGRVQRRRR